MKKVLSSILFFIIVITCMLSLSSCKKGFIFAVETPEGLTVKQGIFYDGYSVTGRDDSKEEQLVIGNNYNGKNITKIGKKAFADDKDLRIAVIPSSVKVIENQAFENCINLICVYIGYAENGENIVLDGNKSKLERIDKRVFAYCAQLTHIFYNGTMADFKAISKDISAVNCWHRETVEPLTIVCSDGSLEYRWQRKDAPVEIPKEPEKPLSKGLEFTLNDDKTGYDLSGLGSCKDADIVIPSTYNGKKVTGIKHKAFIVNYSNNHSIKSIYIPDTVTSIDPYAFTPCKALKTISVPDSVTSIGEGAFDGCDSLQFNEYGNALYVGNENNPYLVLVGPKNSSVTSITLHEKTKIEPIRNNYLKFAYVAQFNVPESNGYFKSIDGNLYSKDGKTLLKYAAAKKNTSFTVPSHVETIDCYAFSGSNFLKNVVISNGVKTIQDFAFINCSSLTKLTVPSSVTYIGIGWYCGCTSFERVDFAGTVQRWKEIDYDDPDVIIGLEISPHTIYCSDGKIERFYYFE